MTLLRIDPTTDVPPYEQLRRQLMTQIQTGQLPTDTKLPAVRRLAADLGIAPGTVARAYKELENEGYLVTRGRNGTLVAALTHQNPAQQARKLTVEYVTAMRTLGLDMDSIIGEVRATLAES